MHTKFELVKFFSYLRDYFDAETIMATPAYPSINGLVYSGSKIYHLNMPTVDASVKNSSELLKFEMIQYDTTDRINLISNLSGAMKTLAPILSTIDSSVSVREPMFYVIYRFNYFFLAEIVKVILFI